MWRLLTTVTAVFSIEVAAQICRTPAGIDECQGTSLDCSHQSLWTLQNVSLSQLRCLSLAFTHLSSIQGSSLEKATSLRHLELQGNLLDHLNPHVFCRLRELEYLDLSNNSIASLIDGRLFASQTKLRILRLDLNKISHIDMRVVSPLVSLTELTLSGNPFHCDGYMLQLLQMCRHRGLNTSVICEEPEEYKGYSWEMISSEEVGFVNMPPGDRLVPKKVEQADKSSLSLTILIIAIIVFIIAIIVINTMLAFYCRRKKVAAAEEKSDARTSMKSDAFVINVKCEEDAGNGPSLSGVSTIDLLKEEEMTVEDVDICLATNPRFSGEYDNISTEL